MTSVIRAVSALGLLSVATAGVVYAKLPAPQLTDEQKAAAELAKAKAAHQSKVDAYLTCKAADRAASHYFKNHPQAAKPANAPACTDPGPFVPPAAAGVPAPAPSATAVPAAKKS